MQALETGFELVNILRTEGLAGLWEYIKEQFQDLKATVIDAVMDLIQTQVVQAGIKWLLGLLSPVGAFVKAVMAIIDVVKFFIERAAQIVDLVNAFMDSVSAIASGKVGAVAASIEKALGRAVPVVIGLLASILGIGGLARKVIKLFKKIQKRVEKALVKLWKKIKKLAKKFLKKIGFGKKKDKERKGTPNSTEDVNNFTNINEEFSDITGNDTHHAYYKGENPILIVESDPTEVGNLFINKMGEASEQNDDELRKDVIRAKKFYYGSVKPKEKELKAADFEDEQELSEASKSRQSKAKGFNDNDKVKSELQETIEVFSNEYLTRLFKPDDKEYPTTVLPVMANNSKAGGFTADYIKSTIHTGTEASQHTGNLEGWAELTAERKQSKTKWVKMHLLPHQIGGDAKDSNLTPALGEINKRFSKKLELKAIHLAKKASKDEREVIWYKFDISYHDGNVYPKYLAASYGTYSKIGDDWERNEAIKTYSESPVLPDAEFRAFNMKENDWDTKLFADTVGVTEGFAKKVKEFGGYSDLDDLEFIIEENIKMNTTNLENLNVLLSSKQKKLIIFN